MNAISIKDAEVHEQQMLELLIGLRSLPAERQDSQLEARLLVALARDRMCAQRPQEALESLGEAFEILKKERWVDRDFQSDVRCLLNTAREAAASHRA